MDTVNYIIAKFIDSKILVGIPDPTDLKMDQLQLVKEETLKDQHGAIIKYYLYIEGKWERIRKIGTVDKSKRVWLRDLYGLQIRYWEMIMPSWAGPSTIFRTP